MCDFHGDPAHEDPAHEDPAPKDAQGRCIFPDELVRTAHIIAEGLDCISVRACLEKRNVYADSHQNIAHGI